MPKRSRTTTVLLVGTYTPTGAMAYTADAPVHCADCGDLIAAGDSFTRGFYPGGGRSQGDLCRRCRPFTSR